MWILRHLHPRAFARRAPLLVLVLALGSGVAACAAPVASTRIERGEKVTTGDEAFDAFFREVSDVKAEADRSGAEASGAAKPLTDALGAPGKGTPAPEVVRAEAKKLQMDGTLLHLDLVPETKLVIASKPSPSKDSDAPEGAILEAAEQAAKASLAVARRGGEILLRIADLERRRVELVAKAKTTFTDATQRNAVSLELVAAAGVLDAARRAAEEHAGAASRLALDLAIALETGAGSGVAAKKPPPRYGGKPGGAGTSAPAKPKGDDFDR